MTDTSEKSHDPSERPVKVDFYDPWAEKLTFDKPMRYPPDPLPPDHIDYQRR